MIYTIDAEGKPRQFAADKEQFEKWKAILAKEFPYSFQEPFQPVQVKLAAGFRQKRERFVAGRAEDGAVGSGYTIPSNNSIATAEKILYGDRRQMFYFSPKPPVHDGKKIKWEGGWNNFKRDFSIDPRQNLELLMWLYFLSSDVKNGDRGGKKKDIACTHARWEFVMPEKVAAEDLGRIRNNEKIHRYVTNESTQVPYSKLKKIAATMEIGFTGIEDRDRVTVYNYLQDPAKFAMFERLMDDIKDSPVFDLSEIKAKVNKAKTMKVLVKEDGVFRLKTTGGDTIMDIKALTGAPEKDEVFALVEHLKGDPKAVEAINKLIAEQ